MSVSREGTGMVTSPGRPTQTYVRAIECKRPRMIAHAHWSMQ